MPEIRLPSAKGSALDATEAPKTWLRSRRTSAGNFSLTNAYNRDSTDLTAAQTVTIPDVATLIAACETSDFETTLNNVSAAACTLAVTGSDTINGANSNYIIPAKQSITIRVNQAGNGVIIISRANTSHSGAFVYRTTTQAIGTGSETAINFTAASYDTHDAHVGGDPTKITIPAGVTVASFSGQVTIEANGTGVRYITLHVDGSAMTIPMTVRENAPSGTFVTVLSFNTGPITVAAGEYYELKVYQNSGGNLNVGTASGNTWFKAEFK